MDAVMPISALQQALTPDSTWRLIREAMQGLKLGSVTLIVRDGQLIQVDRTEAQRRTTRHG